ncbi:MAG: hypothetical protein WDM94_03955 [Bauldia sp.]
MLGRAAMYLRNCFWLIVPVLAFDLLFTGRLPAQFQMENFWRDIPAFVGVPENIFRTVVLVLPVLMPLDVVSARQRAGLALYLAGIAVYLAAWVALIACPDSGWSLSAAGQLAPAYTPALWLGGIGLVGGRLFVARIPYRYWMYLALSAVFLVFHVTHTAIVFARG